MSNCSVKYCQKTPTKVNVLTEVSAKGYLLIHKFLVQVKLKYCERNKIIVCKLDSLFCVLCFSVLCSLSLQELSISLPWKVFFGGWGGVETPPLT